MNAKRVGFVFGLWVDDTKVDDPNELPCLLWSMSAGVDTGVRGTGYENSANSKYRDSDAGGFG